MERKTDTVISPEGIFPEGFVGEIETLLGKEQSGLFFAAMQKDPAVAVRLNPAKAPEGLFADCREVEWCGNGRRLDERPQFTLDPLLHAGAYYVQDPSSMIHAAVVEELSEKVLRPAGIDSPALLDMCAAPGGKTTAMLSALENRPGTKPVVVANEFVARRGEILRENLAKWGSPNMITTGCDTSCFAKAGALFDIVAVDAPCSGEGMMRKDDEALSQWSESLVEQCATLQREILSNAVKALKEGGVLIYSTCTFNVHEDEENCRYLVEEYGLEPMELSLPGVPDACRETSRRLGFPGAVRFMPHLAEGEGLFLAVFRKPGKLTAESDLPLPTKKKKKEKSGKSKEVLPDFKEYIRPDYRDTYQIETIGGVPVALARKMSALLAGLEKYVRVKSVGTQIAELKGRDWVPAPLLPLSLLYNREAFPYVELSEKDALQYLRREALNLPPDTPKGYVAVGFRGLPLGFLKNLGNRANNLYPQEWRIRKML